MGPAPGGMSAVGGTGSVYKFYDNNTLASDGKIKEGIDGFVSSGVKETFFVNKEKSADGNRHRVAPEEGPKKVEEGVCVEETITVNLQGLLDKLKEDCPKLMATLELPDEPIPLWWTADFINGSPGECWKPAVGDEKKSWASLIAHVSASPSALQPTASLILQMCPGRTFLQEKRQMQQPMATSWGRRLQRCWVLLKLSLTNVSRRFSKCFSAGVG